MKESISKEIFHLQLIKQQPIEDCSKTAKVTKIINKKVTIPSPVAINERA